MVILQSILVCIHMCIVPYLVGQLFVNPRNRNEESGVAYTMAAGLMILYALYEVMILMFDKLGQGFRALSYMYLILSVVLAVSGGILMFIRKQKICFKFSAPDVYMIIACILIVIQVGAILILATPDNDDAFYSGLSSMSIAYDYLLEFHAYDGQMISPISKRYMVSALPIYQASLSLFSGMHHLIITHNLFPLFYMPLAYGIYYQIGKRFLEKEHMPEAIGKFMLAFALMHMIGNYYVFSPENFLVTRMWQGKALFVAIGVPMLWITGRRALFLDERKNTFLKTACAWILVAASLLACSFMGETGLFLGPFMLGCQTFSACIIIKKWKKIIPAVICCVPEAVLFVHYLM